MYASLAHFLFILSLWWAHSAKRNISGNYTGPTNFYSIDYKITHYDIREYIRIFVYGTIIIYIYRQLAIFAEASTESK